MSVNSHSQPTTVRYARLSSDGHFVDYEPTTMADRIVVGGGAILGFALPIVLQFSGINHDWGVTALECVFVGPTGGSGSAAIVSELTKSVASGLRKLVIGLPSLG
jgi:hypothetical protein